MHYELRHFDFCGTYAWVARHINNASEVYKCNTDGLVQDR